MILFMVVLWVGSVGQKGCGSKPFASRLLVLDLGLINLTCGIFCFGYLGSRFPRRICRFSVIFVSWIVINLLSLSDFGRQLIGGGPFKGCIVISFLSLSDFGRRLVGGIVFVSCIIINFLCLSDFGRRPLGEVICFLFVSGFSLGQSYSSPVPFRFPHF